MLDYVANYFSLRKSFVFYGAYHHNKWNQIAHLIFVPVIFTTAMSFLARVPLGGDVNLSHLIAALYAFSFIVMEPLAGTLYVPLLGLMEYVGAGVLVHHVPVSVALHLLGWASQIIAHRWAEHRAPAFIEDPLQALHAAVFFVWLEVLFFCGYRPAVKFELDRLIRENIATMDKGERVRKARTKRVRPAAPPR